LIREEAIIHGMVCFCAVLLLLIKWGTAFCKPFVLISDTLRRQSYIYIERERESMLCICAVWLLLIRWGTVCREGGRERERWA
tara:strand:+ start:165 stop:413 length:249 start_codon:yes stop_codon:yes gene_type:complete